MTEKVFFLEFQIVVTNGAIDKRRRKVNVEKRNK